MSERPKEPLRGHRDVAAALRDDAPAVDDIARARMEKALLEHKPGQSRVDAPRGGFRAGVLVGLAAAAAVAMAIWAWLAAEPSGLARVEVLEGGVPERTTAIGDGETVVTSEAQLLRVRFGPGAEPSTLVEVTPESRVEFVSVEASAHRMVLERGRVRVEFHPERRGEETVQVQTEDATIYVVGTVFEVHVDMGGTRVLVEEGVVRVETRSQSGRAYRVAAGERVHVERLRSVAGEPEQTVDSVEAVAVAEAPSGESPLLEAERPTPAAHARSGPTVEPAGVEATLEEGLDPLEEEVEESTPAAAEPPETIPLSDDVRFDLARRLFDGGDLQGARHELYAIARTTRSGRSRAQAWTLVAETYERQSDTTRAIEAYRRAAHGRSPEATDALFALARLRVSSGQREAGKAAYLEYLQVAPGGALASSVHRALCRLGERTHCAE